MPKLTGVTALAQNYLFLSLNALYEINQITIFLFQFFIPTCSDTLVGITTLRVFKVTENSASFEKRDFKHSCIYRAYIRVRSPAKSI